MAGGVITIQRYSYFEIFIGARLFMSCSVKTSITGDYVFVNCKTKCVLLFLFCFFTFIIFFLSHAILIIGGQMESLCSTTLRDSSCLMSNGRYSREWFTKLSYGRRDSSLYVLESILEYSP